ncbi:MAG: nucleotidyltransferase [Gallionellaceae bacterium]|nr:MAG: nucleotidyltransferase [Gallionellaceae bacterium]
MPLNVEHLLRTVSTLEAALEALQQRGNNEVMHDLYRNAAIKSFELSLETAGKLLRKAIKAFGGSPREVDKLIFNDVLRHAGKHGMLELAEVERWIQYRTNRNSTAHDYGEGFANETLRLLPGYVTDARALAISLQKVFDAESH